MVNLEVIETISDKAEKRIDLVIDRDTGMVFIQKIILGDMCSLYEAVKTLNSRYLPKIYSVSYKDEHTYVVVEKIEMLTLDKYLERSKADIRDVYKVANDIAHALRDLHMVKIVDRDVKPANIFYDGDKALLFDFDIARFYGNHAHDTRLLGSPGYAAPEQYGFGESNDKSDIYGLGKVMDYMLKKGGLEDRHLFKIIDKATKIDPKDRYRDIDHLIDDLTYLDSYALPGFRKGTSMTKILALVGYILLFCFAINIRYKDYAPRSFLEIVSKLEGMIWLFMIALYCGDYRHMRSRLTKGKNLLISLLISFFVIFLFLVIIVSIGELIIMIVGYLPTI